MTKAVSRPRVRRNIWMFAFLSLVFAYLSQLGMTFNGVLGLLELQPFTLALFGFIAVVWLAMRWRKKWVWHRTPLDFALLLWAIAFVLSIATNPNTVRRSLEGMWYIILYVSIWYLLLDVIANGGISRQTLVQSFLFAGFTVMLFGWYSTWLVLQTSGWSEIPRPSGLIGNPNAFGAFILLLIPFGVVQTINTNNRFTKIMMGLYTASAFVLLILSQSRGAWLGFVGAMGVLLLMLLAEYKLLSFSALKSWWKVQPRMMKVVLVIGIVLFISAGLFMTNFLISSLSAGGRSIALRTYMWSAAIAMFRDSPLTGQGFFTYGQHLSEYASIPPTQPQAHAHNVLMTMIAELGLLGLIAIVTSVILTIATIWCNWKQITGAERMMFIASAAGVLGFGIHHLVDTPSMMPIIALANLLMLAIALAPAEPIAFNAAWRKLGHPIGLVGMWVVLMVAGLWSSGMYRQYYAVLQDVAALNDCRVFDNDDCELVDAELFAENAHALQAIINADPRQPAYILQQSYLYGLAASDGDMQYADLAIAGYERYLKLEPTHPSAWSNLAALYWQMGNQARARSAIEQAIFYAPDWTHYKRQRDIYVGILTDAETITPPIPTLDGLNWSRLQYLREALPEYLPQVGWGS